MAETNEFDAYWDDKLSQRNLEVGGIDVAKGIAGAAVKGTGSLISNLSAGDIARGTRGLVDPTMNKVEEGGIIDTALTWLNDTFDPEGNERQRVSERVKDLQASGSLPKGDGQNKDLTVAALPGLSALADPLKGAEVIGDIADKAIKPTAKFIGEPIKDVGQGIIESTSPDMQEAMSNPELFKDGKLGRGAGDPAAWAGVAAQAVGSLIPTVATAAITKNPTAGLGVGMGMSVGQAGDGAYEVAINSNPMDLIDSPIFVGELKKVSQDPEFAELDGAAKVEEAQRRYAELSSSMAKSKPETIAAAAMGTMLGDATIVKTMLGSGAGGAVRGMLKGAATEAPGEFGEEWLQQYVGNTTQNEMASKQLVEPMAGTLDAGLHGAAGGVMAGGAMGGAAAKFAKVLHANKDNLTPEQAVEVVERSMKNRGVDDATARQVAEQAAGMMTSPDLEAAVDGLADPPQASSDQNPLGPSASQFPGVFERDQRGILRVKGDVDALASWAEQADMPYITDGDGIAIPAKYAKQAEKAIKGYRPVAAEPMAEAAPADMLAFSQVDPIEHEPAIKRQGFVMRNGDGQSTGEPEPYVRPQSGDELLYESSANWQAGQPHAESAPVDLEALRKESAQRWRDGNKPEAGTPVRTEEDTEQALNALRAEGVNGWAGRQDPKLDMPKGQEFIPHGPQAGLPAVVGDGVQQAAGKAKGLPLSDTTFAGGPSHGGQADNTNYARPHLTREQVDTSMGEQSTRDPRSPVAQSIEQAGSATDSVFGPLKSLRITRKGKPFATEKEAAMASRKGQEMPVPLNGGGFGVAAIGEVQQAQAQQGAVKQPSSNSAQQDRQDGKTEIAQNGMVIVHGSGNPGMSEQDIQIVRASGQKQGKKGRVYGGFYGTSEQDAHQAQAYADMMGGTPTLYDVKIKPGTKVLHKQGDITRLSESYINELVSQGYGVVTGTDPRGQTEHVVIDKSAVASMAPRGAQATPSQVNDTNVADMRQPSDQPAASVSAETVPAPSATAGEASQLAPAIDTGYRDVIPSSEQSEVTHDQPAPIPAISSERSGDQPGAGDPVATSVGPTPAELAERAGPGDPANGTSLAPVPVTQPGEENALTAPAPAGVAVSEGGQPEQARATAGPAAVPTPWSGMIDNPDGTITLEGEVAALKSWAKDNGVKAIPGKGGLVVSTTSVAKVRELTTSAPSEPVRQIEAARAEIAPEPTEAQKEAGNYKKGHITLQGLDIALENPKGSTRSGTDQDGRAWQSTMAHDYGYIKRTQGADGDHVDVFIGDKPESEMVYVVDQVDPKTGKFDEHKVMMGFADEQAAREGYLGNYEAGWKGLGAIKAMPVESFKRWVKEGDTTKPADSMESEPVDANALADEEAIAVADELGIEHGDNPDDARWGLDGIKADVLAAAVGRVRNPSEPVAIKRPLDNPNIVAAPPMEGDPVTRAKKVRMSQQREGGYEGLSVDEATRIVDDFLADFNGNIPLKPFIREKVSEIYRNVADDSDTARTTKGAYHPSADLFTVVAGNARGTVSGSPALRLQKGRLRESVELGAKADLLKTLRHELLGHYGLDTFAPEDKRALLQKLIAAQKEPWLAPAWRHASNLGDQLDAIKEHERELAVAEEAFARLAERELPSRAIQTWNDIKATFSRLLRKIGLVKGPIKEHELDSLIRAVSKGIRNGERTRQNIRGDKEVIGKQADEPAKADKPERIIRFSKQAMAQGEKPAKHLTRKEAELVTKEWFKQYRGASGIDVQIHATQVELEKALGLATQDGLIRRAAFDDDSGTLHVAADTIANPKRMREILRHEVLAHYGLANVLGDGEYTKLMSRLIQSQKDPSMKPVWDWVNTHYADEDIGTQAEEVVAHLAELEQGAWGRGWDRVVAWVTRALRAVGFVPDGITAAETRSLIEGLGKKLRKADAEVGAAEGEKLWFSAERSPWGKDFPEVILHGRLADATSHPDYVAAKGGDDAAARRLVRDVLSPDAIGKLKALVGVRPAIALGVHAEEAVSRNAIPSAMADILGKVLGIEVDLDIMQSAKVGRTAQDGFGRLANQPGFDGPVRNDKPYLIMDDTLTQGGTLANLKGYIENRGGEVLAATALTGKQYSAKIAIDSSTLEQLRDQYDGTGLEAWWHNRFGYGFDSLTESEGRYLLRAKDADKVRDRVAAAGPQTSARSEYESARDDGSLPPNGLKFSQTNSAADEALQKLNLGPKPDIIDKTKASLNKLRQVDRGVVSSWIDRVIKKANTEVLDALAPIKYAEEAAGITDAADSGYVAARMATGAASTMQATMLYGLPEWNDGVIQRKAGTGEKDALLGIFADLGADLHNWLGWMAGHRAELLMAQGRENLLDANDIAALKGQGKGKEAKFLDAKARWNRLNAATLDLAQEAGLFTKEARAEFESEWYIPFFRESDDGDVIAPFKTKGIANQNSGIKKLKGGEANTNDLLENIFTSTSKLIDASMKNMAAQKTVWNLADTGIIEVIPKPNKMDYQALANGKDRIMVKLEGEDYMIRVEDPDLYRAMTFFDRKPFGAMVNVAAKAKRLLTAGVTASPEFMLRNFLRDSLSSWAISKDGFRPVIDSIKGVKKTLAMDGSTIDVMFSGASFLGGYVNGNDPEAMADTVRKSLRRKGMTPEQIARYEKSIIRNAAQAKGVVANVWEKYNRYGEAFENANREAVYAAAIKAGKSHAQAAFESKDLMDFSMLGASRTMQVMTQLLPFFNARVQGLGKLTRELRDNPRAIAKRAGMITAASLALLAANWDDERYEELPDWDKDTNWHFFVGDQHFRIPKPFEIGVLFGTIPERMVRAMGDKDTGAQFGKAVARAIGDTFALNPIPQLAKPVVETTVNYDFFKGGPIDGPQDLNVRAEARYNEQTSLLMRELGELTGFSPKQLEHLVIGYTGTMGSYVMAAADGLIRASRPGESASWRADEIPLVKAVYRGTGPAKSTQHMEEFYRMLNEVNQLKRTVDQYRSEGLTDKANELLEEQGGILKSRRSLSRTQQQVRVVRNKIELIQRDRTMTAEEKRRRIDEMLARRNDLVYQAVNKNKANWE